MLGKLDSEASNGGLVASGKLCGATTGASLDGVLGKAFEVPSTSTSGKVAFPLRIHLGRRVRGAMVRAMRLQTGQSAWYVW